MNRRAFLAGLATTTAMVAAGGVPAAAASERIARRTRFIEAQRCKAARLSDRLREVLDLAEPVEISGRPGASVSQSVAAMEDAATAQFRWLLEDAQSRIASPWQFIDDDLRLYGVSFRRLPGGERIDPREVYLGPTVDHPDPTSVGWHTPVSVLTPSGEVGLTTAPHPGDRAITDPSQVPAGLRATAAARIAQLDAMRGVEEA